MTNYATTEWNNKVVLHDDFWNLDDESKLAVLKHEEVHRKQPLWRRVFKNKECELEAYEAEKVYSKERIYILRKIYGSYPIPKEYSIDEIFNFSESFKKKIDSLAKMLANAESEIERLRE